MSKMLNCKEKKYNFGDFEVPEELQVDTSLHGQYDKFFGFKEDVMGWGGMTWFNRVYNKQFHMESGDQIALNEWTD